MADELAILQQGIIDLKSATDAAKQTITDGFAAKNKQIADLQAQLAGGVTPAQLTTATADIKAVQDEIATIPTT